MRRFIRRTRSDAQIPSALFDKCQRGFYPPLFARGFSPCALAALISTEAFVSLAHDHGRHGRTQGMSVIPHLPMLGIVAMLGSSVPQQVDFKPTSPDGVQRIDQLWLVTYIDNAGREIVVQAKLANGDYAPLIAADRARLESIMVAARGLATANNVRMRLVEFTSRRDVEDIAP
jgi:hypothetical protein